jgi:acyl carrier protein
MRERVAALIREVKGYSAPIDGEARLIEDLHFDSMEVMTLILRCEEAFSITFRDQDLDLECFLTVDRVVDTLRRYVGPA